MFGDQIYNHVLFFSPFSISFLSHFCLLSSFQLKNDMIVDGFQAQTQADPSICNSFVCWSLVLLVSSGSFVPSGVLLGPLGPFSFDSLGLLCPWVLWVSDIYILRRPVLIPAPESSQQAVVSTDSFPFSLRFVSFPAFIWNSSYSIYIPDYLVSFRIQSGSLGAMNL